MPRDFPLWRLRPEDAARIIILEPTIHIPSNKNWRKRAMRIKPSPRSAPRQDDMKTLHKAGYWPREQAHRYWEQYAKEYAAEFPLIGVLHGPLLRDGGFLSPHALNHPLALDRPKSPWLGIYSRAQYDHDMEVLEAGRSLLRENFILGQRDEGPYIDGLVFLKADKLYEAEMLRCKNRLQATIAILQSKSSGVSRKPRENDNWKNIGLDEAVAMKWKQSGFTVRKIDTLTNRHWEVLFK